MKRPYIVEGMGDYNFTVDGSPVVLNRRVEPRYGYIGNESALINLAESEVFTFIRKWNGYT